MDIQKRLNAQRSAIFFNKSTVTIDCDSELLKKIEKKAQMQEKNLNEYLLGLIAKDAAESTPKYVDQKVFDKILDQRLNTDENMLRKLAQR